MLTKLPAGSFFGATTLRRDIGGVDVTVPVPSVPGGLTLSV